jgi:hypothetical protein
MIMTRENLIKNIESTLRLLKTIALFTDTEVDDTLVQLLKEILDSETLLDLVMRWINGEDKIFTSVVDAGVVDTLKELEETGTLTFLKEF